MIVLSFKAHCQTERQITIQDSIRICYSFSALLSSGHGVVVRTFSLYWGGFRFESLSTHHCWALSSSLVVWLVTNMPGTAQVGAISKAQKFSRNNYCERFQLSHSAEHTRKGFPRDSKTALFLNWSPLIEFKSFRKNRIVPKKPKGPFGFTYPFGSIKNCGLVRESNPALLHTLLHQTPEN